MKNKPQNIYDNSEFFQGYFDLRHSEQGFNTLLDQPAIHALLPNLANVTAVDLGCGYGDLCRYLREQGAVSVLGVDVSEKMLQIANERTHDPAIHYQRMAIEDFSAAPNSIDLVVSSLALHYVADYPAIIKHIYHCLKPGGHLVFSTEHPICTANPNNETVQDSQGATRFAIADYRDEGQIRQTWFVDNVIKYHRTVQTYVNEVIKAGFTLLALLEPMPTDAQIAERPHFAILKIRPSLLVISAVKNLGGS